jgi:phosphonate transport system substrate-binding protein
MNRLLVSAVAMGFLLGVGSCVPAFAETLVIVVQPTQTPEQLSVQAQELEAVLEQELGLDVELRFPTSYAGAIEALRFGHAQAAFMGAWPAALAHTHAQAEVVLAEVREISVGQERREAPYYYSYWVVRQESPYQALTELRGKSAAFPSLLSTSGYVAPVARLVELGLVGRDPQADPQQFFGEVRMAGGYAQAWEALRSGQVEVSVIAGDVPEALYREVLSQTRVIETQGPIPSHAVVVSPTLDAGLRQRLVAALLTLNQPERRILMRKFISGIFVRFEPTDTPTHLGSLQQMLSQTGLLFTEEKR